VTSLHELNIDDMKGTAAIEKVPGRIPGHTSSVNCEGTVTHKLIERVKCETQPLM